MFTRVALRCVGAGSFGILTSLAGPELVRLFDCPVLFAYIVAGLCAAAAIATTYWLACIQIIDWISRVSKTRRRSNVV
jgi:hypothetical protein